MSNKKDEILKEIYEEYGFLFKDFNTLKSKLESYKATNGNYDNAIESYINDECISGNFYRLFVKFERKYGVVESFTFFDNLLRSYHTELSDDDFESLCNDNLVEEYYNDHKEELKKLSLRNTLLNNIIDVFSLSEGNFEIPLTGIGEKYFSEDITKDYLVEISKIPLLTAEEEKEKFTELKRLINSPERDEDAIKALKDEITERNLRLVVSIAVHYSTFCESFELIDLIQEGNIGLMKSFERFDIDKGFKFSTYSTWWIKQAITRSICNGDKAIRIPVHAYDDFSKIKKYLDKYVSDNGEEPSDKKIAEDLNILESTVYAYRNKPTVAASMDQPVGEDEDSVFGDFVESSIIEPTEKQIEDEDLRTRMHRYVDSLVNESDRINNPKKYQACQRKALIIKMRFGIDGYYPHTLEQIGKKLGVTRERVRQIENKTLRELNRKYGLVERQNILAQNGDSNAFNGIVNKYLDRQKKYGYTVIIDEYNFNTNHVKMKCLNCGSTWTLLVGDLNRKVDCNKCYRERQKEVSKMTFDKETLLKVSKEIKPFHEYVGVSYEELEEVFKRLPYNDQAFINKFYGQPLNQIQDSRMRKLAIRLKSDVEKMYIRKQREQQRKRKKSNN